LIVSQTAAVPEGGIFFWGGIHTAVQSILTSVYNVGVLSYRERFILLTPAPNKTSWGYYESLKKKEREVESLYCAYCLSPYGGTPVKKETYPLSISYISLLLVGNMLVRRV
jgi:hypothetical protein